MSFLTYKNKRLPSKKPTGNYEIDWSNSLTDGLVGCWILDDKGGGGLYADLTGNNNGRVIGSTISNAVSDGEMATKFTGDNGTDRINLGSIDSNNPLSCSKTNEFSIVSKVRQTSVSGNLYPRIYDKSNSGGGLNGYCLWLNSSDNKLWIKVDSNSLTEKSSQFTVPLNITSSVAVTYSKSAINYYLNGVPGGNIAISGVNIPTTTTNAAIGHWNHGVDREWHGEINYVYVYDRVITPAEAKQLADTPYQFLKPANDPVYFLSDSGGDTTLTHDITNIQCSGLEFSSNSDSTFQTTSINNVGLSFTLDNNSQFDVSSIQNSGLDFTSDNILSFDVSNINATGFNFLSDTTVLFDVSNVTQTGLDFYSNKSILHSIGVITTTGIEFADGSVIESWSLGVNEFSGLDFVSNKTSEFALSVIINSGIEFQTNTIYDFSITAINSTGLDYKTNNSTQFNLGSITYSGLEYTSFIGQAFDITSVINTGLTFKTNHNSLFDIGLIDTSGLFFAESSTGEKINLQFAWLDYKKEMQFTQRNRGLELYE